MKTIRIISGLQMVCILLAFAFLAGVAEPVFAELPPEEEGVCARVRIRLSQKITIARTAFRATLEIENAPENVALENVTVTLDIQDTAYESVNNLFDIRDPEVTDIGDVNGNGTILPGTSAKAVWMMIPTRDAAPEADTRYFVGGTLSYTESGTQIEIPLFPASITVMPDPLLVLDYFWVREVYSDDPFRVIANKVK
ncbi:MAG: hypothetical protein DRI57_06550 [Deltaproteobacteria bacterium]|nr:MAG: hypothetical protein DRI57_06550 [Deltaproteobacteria bacterium]